MSLVPKLPNYAAPTIRQFLRHHGADEGARGFVIGMSGGIDSAVAAQLAAEAVGGERVLAVLLPDLSYPGVLREETLEFARRLGTATRVIPIDGAETGVRASIPEVEGRVARGNVRARVRMTILYALAGASDRRVLGTGNKSELLLGYFTKWGDGGADLVPLGDLYKTQIRRLAVELGIPEIIRNRAPSAGLWEGQTDEEELGFTYEAADQVLCGLEQLMTGDQIVRATGLPKSLVRKIAERVRASRHKRRLPPIPKLQPRTVGLDWRE